MSTLTETAPASAAEKELDRWLLRTAQRADELARTSPSGGSAARDRQTWDLAEGEFLRRLAVPKRRRPR